MIDQVLLATAQKKLLERLSNVAHVQHSPAGSHERVSQIDVVLCEGGSDAMVWVYLKQSEFMFLVEGVADGFDEREFSASLIAGLTMEGQVRH